LLFIGAGTWATIAAFALLAAVLVAELVVELLLLPQAASASTANVGAPIRARSLRIGNLQCGFDG
jgi:hypothetical protein